MIPELFPGFFNVSGFGVSKVLAPVFGSDFGRTGGGGIAAVGCEVPVFVKVFTASTFVCSINLGISGGFGIPEVRFEIGEGAGSLESVLPPVIYGGGGIGLECEGF